MSEQNPPVDEKTPYLDLPLPFPTNNFLDDVQRLRTILVGLDRNAEEVDQALAGIMATFLRMSVADTRYLLAGHLGQAQGVAPLGGDAVVPLVHLPDTRWLYSALLGQANGVAPLGPDGKIASEFLSDSMLGAMTFRGGWDASAGNLPMFQPKNGFYWIVTQAGTTQLGSVTSWGVGDWAVFAGTDWIKVDNTDEVRSVRGPNGPQKKGDVVLTWEDFGLTDFPLAPIQDRFYAIRNGRWAEITNHMPLFMVAWCHDRNSIWPGAFAYDGQEISASIIPQAAEGVNRTVPVVPVCSEALWQSDPTYRGCFTKGSTAGMIRLPDFNGKSVGSIGAVTLRGDGHLSTQFDGRIQPAAMQDHHHPVLGGTGAVTSTPHTNTGGLAGLANPVTTGDVAADNRYDNQNAAGVSYIGNASLLPGQAAAPETRGTNVTGCWVGFLFGAVLNPGSLDAASIAGRISAIEALLSNDIEGSFTTRYLQVQDQKAQGSVGGTPVVNVYNTRDLNTVLHNSIPGAVLASNRVSLPAGTYYVSARAPGFRVGASRVRLQNVTLNQTLVRGTNTVSMGNDSYICEEEASLSGRFTLSSPAQVELQQIFSQTTGGIFCMGAAQNVTGENEVYSNLEIWRLLK